jgi:cation transport regulator
VPYDTTEDLPDAVRHVLPQHGQDIWRAAYNSAWDEYEDPQKRRGDDSREQVAAQVAWAAVKHSYEKDDKTGRWRAKH